MQKLITSFMLSFYLLGSLGVVINVHYCFGEFKSISFYELGEADCCEKFVRKAPCCDDQQIQFSVEADHQVGSGLTLPLPPMEFVAAEKPVIERLNERPANLHPHATGPPLISLKPWIQYQRLIWYG